MKDNLKDEFFIQEQLQSLIHVPVNDVTIDLSSYIYVDAILSQRPLIDGVKFYVKGFVKVNTNILSDEQGHAYKDNDGNITSWQTYQCGEYCSRPDMNEITGLVLPIEENDIDQQIYYNFSEFKNRCDSIGLPIKDKSEIKYIKSFNYDTELINQKTLFTLYEACSIASNTKLTSIPRLMFDCELFNHNLSILAECVKGQNQKGFHLITKELWILTTDDCYEPCNRKYKNGTTLNIDVDLDNTLTIISKNELIRWCKFMDIETGLTKDDDVENESIEYLKLEIERLNKRVIELIPIPPKYSPAPPHQIPPLPKKDNSEIKNLNETIARQEKEIVNLKENTFPIMTNKLIAMLKTQKKFWVAYERPELQKNIKAYIKELLDIDGTKESRIADELAKAIQPDGIIRK